MFLIENRMWSPFDVCSIVASGEDTCLKNIQDTYLRKLTSHNKYGIESSKYKVSSRVHSFSNVLKT